MPRACKTRWPYHMQARSLYVLIGPKSIEPSPLGTQFGTPPCTCQRSQAHVAAQVFFCRSQDFTAVVDSPIGVLFVGCAASCLHFENARQRWTVQFNYFEDLLLLSDTKLSTNTRVSCEQQLVLNECRKIHMLHITWHGN